MLVLVDISGNLVVFPIVAFVAVATITGIILLIGTMFGRQWEKERGPGHPDLFPLGQKDIHVGLGLNLCQVIGNTLVDVLNFNFNATEPLG